MQEIRVADYANNGSNMRHYVARRLYALIYRPGRTQIIIYYYAFRIYRVEVKIICVFITGFTSTLGVGGSTYTRVRITIFVRCACSQRRAERLRGLMTTWLPTVQSVIHAPQKRVYCRRDRVVNARPATLDGGASGEPASEFYHLSRCDLPIFSTRFYAENRKRVHGTVSDNREIPHKRRLSSSSWRVLFTAPLPCRSRNAHQVLARR